ncbi:MAG TPA: hypothetical protein VM370_09690 [Candidatus Thermoplasmatota archaeon]|nr:hypothetical protein [Candidatus Thermoplasmatota archaeon]
MTTKEMKVKIPARLHVQLQTLKILQGRSIQETVTAALEQYFLTQPSPVLRWEIVPAEG